MRKVGRAIRKARKALKMGVRELAREVKCSPGYISMLERGAVSGGLGGPKTQAILRTLGCTTDYLLGREK